MLDRLVTFLKTLPGPAPRSRRAEADDPRVAAVALMFHVVDADGERSERERRRLGELVREAYGAAPDIGALIEAGEEADREAVDLYAFTSVLGRHLDTEGRLELIRILWELAYADGGRHELEENIVWRVAELIGVDSRERVELRRQVEAAREGKVAH